MLTYRTPRRVMRDEGEVLTVGVHVITCVTGESIFLFSGEIRLAQVRSE